MSIVITPSILRVCLRLTGLQFSKLSKASTALPKQKALIGLELMVMRPSFAQCSKLSTGAVKLPNVCATGLSASVPPTAPSMLITSCDFQAS